VSAQPPSGKEDLSTDDQQRDGVEVEGAEGTGEPKADAVKED
jgi:hypothetical protein